MKKPKAFITYTELLDVLKTQENEEQKIRDKYTSKRRKQVKETKLSEVVESIITTNVLLDVNKTIEDCDCFTNDKYIALNILDMELLVSGKHTDKEYSILVISNSEFTDMLVIIKSNEIVALSVITDSEIVVSWTNENIKFIARHDQHEKSYNEDICYTIRFKDILYRVRTMFTLDERTEYVSKYYKNICQQAILI